MKVFLFYNIFHIPWRYSWLTGVYTFGPLHRPTDNVLIYLHAYITEWVFLISSHLLSMD